MLNNVQLIGRVGQDPIKKVNKLGSTLVEIGLATNEYYKKGTEKQTKTTWFSLVFWNDLADLVESYTKKGDQIYVEGSINFSEWEDKEGTKRTSAKVNVKKVVFIGGRVKNENKEESLPQKKNNEFIEDDIPF